MHLTRMRPDQLQAAIQQGLPLIMGAGVVEYHGPHLPIGTDMMIAEYIAIEVEKRCPCVLAPTLPYGPTLSWAGGPAEGEMDFDPEPFYVYVKEMMKRFMLMGFKRMYIIQHHQGNEGLQSLSLRRAAQEIVREETSKWGDGWGRVSREQLPMPSIFETFTIAGIDAYLYENNDDERMPIGHAGKGETQLIQHIDPDTVRMDNLIGKELPAWLIDASEANSNEGLMWLERCIDSWVNQITSNK